MTLEELKKESLEEQFEEWRDTKGGWPSRTECFEEFFLPNFEKAFQLGKEVGKGECLEEIEKSLEINNYDEIKDVQKFITSLKKQ